MAINWKATNTPVILGGFEPNNGEYDFWGDMDIATPGSAVGDGVPDGGSIPLRMIITPINPATHTVNASNFRVREYNYLGEGDGDNNSVQSELGNQGYEPSSTEQLDNLYPGWTGGTVTARTWVDGAETTLYGGDSEDTVNITLINGIEKIIMFNFDQLNNVPSVGGTVGNSIYILAYIKSDHNLDQMGTYISSSLDDDASAANGTNYTQKRFEVPLVGTAGEIGEEEEASTSNDTTTTSSEWSSFFLALILTEGAASGITVVPWMPDTVSTTLENPTYNGYNYTLFPSMGGSGGTGAGILFEQNSIWTPQSQAFPDQYFQNTYFFWLIPNDGYFLSRHNLSVQVLNPNNQTVEFNGVDYTTSSNISTSYNSTLTLGGIVYPGNESLLNQTPLNNSTSNTINNPLPVNYYTTLGTNQAFGSPASYRGVTSYKDPVCTLSYSNGDNAGQTTTPIMSSLGYNGPITANHVDLYDTLPYVAGIPIGGVTMNVASGANTVLQNMNNDIGVEYVNGVMPEQYCPSDWGVTNTMDEMVEKNAVLVALPQIARYVPGVNPPNIVIYINGSATPDDGSTCIDFNLSIDINDEYYSSDQYNADESILDGGLGDDD